MIAPGGWGLLPKGFSFMLPMSTVSRTASMLLGLLDKKTRNGKRKETAENKYIDKHTFKTLVVMGLPPSVEVLLAF